MRCSAIAGLRKARAKAFSGNYDVLLGDVLKWADDHLDGGALTAVGHRIVHGGDFTQAVLLDEATMTALTALAPLAPLAPAAQSGGGGGAGEIASRPATGGMFRHRLSPDHGCHGTALRPAAGAGEIGHPPLRFSRPVFRIYRRRWREIAPAQASGRIIIAHLGSGASLCALKAGRSIDTTMSFTPLDGLVMGDALRRA